MKKTVIIGAGVAGLTAGIYTLLSGNDCTLIEKNHNVGGALCSWERDGCLIDGCLHWLTGTKKGTKLNEIWETVGVLNGANTVETKYFYKSELNGETLHFYNDLEKIRNEMLEISPEDENAVNRFCDAVKTASKISCGNIGGDTVKLIRYLNKDLNGLSEEFTHPLLKSAMTDLIDGRFSSLGLIISLGAYTAGNAYLPMGGSRAMAENMKTRFITLGGTLITDNGAEKIITEHSKAVAVRLEKGEMVSGDAFICCTDPAVTYLKLLQTERLPRNLALNYSNDLTPTFSSLHIAFKTEDCRVPFEGTAVFECEPYVLDGAVHNRLAVREFSPVGITAGEGGSVMQCMLFVCHEEAMRWINNRRYEKEEYERQKTALAKMISKRITDRFPELYGKLSVIDIWTPATFSRYLGATGGSYMSFAITKGAVPRKLPERVAGLKNVLLATTWQSPVGGVPISAKRGKYAAERAIKIMSE